MFLNVNEIEITISSKEAHRLLKMVKYSLLNDSNFSYDWLDYAAHYYFELSLHRRMCGVLGYTDTHKELIEEIKKKLEETANGTLS